VRTLDPSQRLTAEQDFLRWRTRGDAVALGRVFDRLAPELLLWADAEGVTLANTDEHGQFEFERPAAARPHLVGAAQNP
jgi:hypothetical protein